jgi:hypothetical protein
VNGQLGIVGGGETRSWWGAGKGEGGVGGERARGREDLEVEGESVVELERLRGGPAVSDEVCDGLRVTNCMGDVNLGVPQVLMVFKVAVYQFKWRLGEGGMGCEEEKESHLC